MTPKNMAPPPLLPRPTLSELAAMRPAKKAMKAYVGAIDNVRGRLNDVKRALRSSKKR